MNNQKWRKAIQPKAIALAAVLVVSSASAVAQNLPDMGITSGDPWQADLFYENHTAKRESVGVSKFRNTLQSEMSKNLNDGWRFRGILRGTYDGVYDINDKEFGKNAGGAVQMGNASGPGADYVLTNVLGAPGLGPYATAMVPYGGGIGSTLAQALAGAQPTNTFVNNGVIPGGTSYAPWNQNSGLQILGAGWNNSNQTGGVGLAVPVRPCDYDSRGCKDFGGYGDKKKSELAMPEFNDRLDFIREAYVTKTFGMDAGQSTFLKVGKQQVVWGRTDLFRVLDVINPVDYSRNNIYDELQDIRIPMWIAQAEYRMGGSESMQDRNLSVVWNFDKFRPNNLGQGGTPNSILDAGNFFRAMSNCWDNGCTVANFAAAGFTTGNNPLTGMGTMGAGGPLGQGYGGLATNFGPGVIGIRNVDLPNWSLDNTQLGMKFEGVTQDGLSFSLNALTYRSQLPSLRGGKGATNAFTGAYQASNPYLIAFDVVYPRVNLLGGSMDFQVESLGAAMRLEGAYTSGEEFANTSRPELYSKNNVWRSVIGFDRPTFVPFISTERTVLFSGQMFYQHIFDHQLYQGLYGQYGMPDWKDNVIATLLMKAFLMNDRLSPEIIFARDFRAGANVAAPAVEWSATDNLKFKFGANYKFGPSQQQHQFDDARNANPFDPYTSIGQGVGQTTGLSNSEPLGRFRAGPIGTAFGQNEIFATMRYKF
ncbi:DUF1302 domain-containing protein [Polynucleobacter sp. 30F-ANTBAC]|uniref:DUF1302 family protein n=1 Tax=Polynucleobacter sp. 30F-ANTBAC TaxID=2689095 RepID=UPI001C0D4A9E|nr:DUF1302 family protein [Polynucleobacter sp. 30F-ANTBAC]MBU3599853.1 DUF1302 domain-containing protein [Polynucleobacter sp. 30F-ANTBAC]